MTKTNRWTWIAGSEEPVVVRAFLSYVAGLGQYVCSVLTGTHLDHYLAHSEESACEKARDAVASKYGPIRMERPETQATDLRIARWNGAPVLVGGETGIALDEDLVKKIATFNARQAQGHFERNVMPHLAPDQQALLKEYLRTGAWDRVPIDAAFAAGFPNLDYQV